MGITRYEKLLESLSEEEREQQLNKIRTYFLVDLISDEEIASKLNLTKTEIINVRNKYRIIRNSQLKLKAKSMRDWKLYLENPNHLIALYTFKTYENELPVNEYVSKISKLVHEKLLSDDEIAKEMNLHVNIIIYLKNKFNIKRTKKEIYEKVNKTCSNWTPEQKLQNSINRQYAMKNRSIEDKIKTREKIKQTCLEKYGVTHNWQTPEIREKVKQISLEKYNTINPAHGYKSKQTKLERYGNENYNNREKYKKTYNNFSKDKLNEIKLKTQQTCLEKYGVSHHMKDENIKHKIQNIFMNKYGTTNPMLLHPNDSCISKLNLKFKQKLEKLLNIKLEVEFNIFNKYYDFKYNNILIELNPTITHNSTIAFAHLTGVCTDINCTKHNPLDKDYHFEKWLLAKNNGYELISIFDWYDSDKILSLLKSKLQQNHIKIGARQTTIKIIDKKTSKVFLDNNHVLGYDRSSDVIYGLYYNDILVSVMSFGKPRYSKEYDWELLRFANLSNHTIYGAASKLWKQFLKDYNPKNVITYTNNDFGNGEVYAKLGFKFKDVLKSSCVWNQPYKNTFIKHTSLIRQGADRLLKNKIDNYFPVGLDREDFINRGGKEEYAREYSLLPENTEWWPGNVDIVKHYGFVDVYSSGTSIYVFENI